MQRRKASKAGASDDSPPTSKVSGPRSPIRGKQQGVLRKAPGIFSVKLMAMSVAAGVLIWAIKHCSQFISLPSNLLSSWQQQQQGGWSPSTLPLLQIHETFGCSTEVEDFRALKATLISQGADLESVDLGYANGRRGLVVGPRSD
jgi:hypothetical protein